MVTSPQFKVNKVETMQKGNNKSPPNKGKKAAKKVQQQQQQLQVQQQQQQQPKKNVSFSTPTKQLNNRNSSTPSPKNFAGSKCYEPPTPQSLPKPPKSWIKAADGDSPASPASATSFQALVNSMQQARQEEMDSRDQKASQHLKFLLNVTA